MDITENVRIPLYGHTSPATAHVVDDYPYGFRLRCKRRSWLEYKPRQGWRFVTQTTNPTNPKVAGEFWNAPKRSTYVPIAAAMYLDREGHVQWGGLGFYADAARVARFVAEFPGADMSGVRAFAVAKVGYSRKRAAGHSGFLMKGVPVAMTADDIAEAAADAEAWEKVATSLLSRHMVEAHGGSDTSEMTFDDMRAAHKGAHEEEKAAETF